MTSTPLPAGERAPMPVITTRWTGSIFKPCSFTMVSWFISNLLVISFARGSP